MEVTDPLQSLDAYAVADLLRLAGYRAEMTQHSDHPFAVVYANGFPCEIGLLPVAGNDESIVMFRTALAGYASTLEAINEWNNTMPMIRASLSPNGVPHLDHNFLTRGATVETFLRHFTWWDQIMARFLNQLKADAPDALPQDPS